MAAIPLLVSQKFESKLLCEISRQRADYFFPARARSQFAHRSDRLCKPAWHDVLEIAQIRGLIQGKTMRGDPTADMNANSRHLLPIHPDAGTARLAPSLNSKFREGVDYRLLHRPNIRH